MLVRRDEDDLGAEAVPDLAQQLDGVRPPAALLRVPQDHALRRDVVVDEARDGRAEGAFLVGADPDEEPVSCASVVEVSSSGSGGAFQKGGRLTSSGSGCTSREPRRFRFPCRCGCPA